MKPDPRDEPDASGRWAEIRLASRPDASGWRRFDRRRERLYRVRRGRDAWLWEIIDANGRTVASGTGSTAQDAMSQADRAV